MQCCGKAQLTSPLSFSKKKKRFGANLFCPCRYLWEGVMSVVVLFSSTQMPLSIALEMRGDSQIRNVRKMTPR